jgi:hypothetical protein
MFDTLINRMMLLCNLPFMKSGSLVVQISGSGSAVWADGSS